MEGSALEGDPAGSSGRRLKTWAFRGFWGLWDQGLFAVANFTVSIILARFLSESAFGAFTLALTVQLGLGAVYNAIFVEPMMVYGSGRYDSYLRKYLGVLTLRWHPRVSLGLLALMLSIATLAWSFGSQVLWSALLGAGLAMPSVLGLNLVRKATYIRSSQHLAALGGLLYLIAVGSGLLLLRQFEALSPLTAFLLIGGSSLVIGSWLLWRLRPVLPRQSQRQLSRSMFHRHSSYGRWSAATSLIAYIPSSIYFLVLPLWVGLAGTAQLKALFNLVLPPLHTITAISTVVLPSLVRARGTDDFAQIVVRTTLFLVVLSVGYWVVLVVFDAGIIELLYSGRYRQSIDLVWLIGLLPITASVGNISASGLRALDRPNLVFVAYVAASGGTIFLGLPLAFFYGVAGAAAAMLLSSVLVAITAIMLLTRTLKGQRSGPVDS